MDLSFGGAVVFNSVYEIDLKGMIVDSRFVSLVVVLDKSLKYFNN